MAGNGAGEEGGLIETPPPQSPAVERNRNQNGVRCKPVATRADQLWSHDFNKMLAVAVLETKQNGSCRAGIDQRGAGGGKARRSVETRAAAGVRSAVDVERRAATGADGIGDEGQTGPTAEAETAILINDFAAGRAAWWEQQIETVGDGVAPGGGSTMPVE